MGASEFIRYCGGSRSLAWLLVTTVGASLLLWCAGFVVSLFGGDAGAITGWLALSASPLTALTRPWTLLTYIVAHLSPLHLLFNTLWLYWFGLMLADVSRDRSIAVLFLGGGVAGGLCYLLTAPLAGYSPMSVLTGDSAAVLSVMTGAACIMPQRRINLFLLGSVKLKWLVIVCGAITLIGANGSGPAATASHAAGILFGICWALQHKGYLKHPAFRASAVTDPKKRKPGRASMAAFRHGVPDEGRLDELLDKIRVSGYDSLSAREKTELQYISSRIDKK